MRLYHFTTAEHAQSNIKMRRLKIARISDLNDPFELIAQDLSDTAWGQLFATVKQQASSLLGFLCFSRTWRNPLMWSHYADRHKGICLGFDVTDDACQPVNYSSIRSQTIQSCFKKGVEPNIDQVTNWLQTKFDGWQYEDEVRLISPLNSSLVEGELYFSPFSCQLRLREIIMGVACPLPAEAIAPLIPSIDRDAQVVRAKLADNTFEVISAAT